MAKVKERANAAISVQEAVVSFLSSPHVKRLRPGTQTEYKSELGFFAQWCQSQHVTLDQVNAKQVDVFLDHADKRGGDARRFQIWILGCRNSL